MGPKLMTCCQPEERCTKEHGRMLKTKSGLGGRKDPCQESRKLENRREKEKDYKKRI